MSEERDWDEAHREPVQTTPRYEHYQFQEKPRTVVTKPGKSGNRKPGSSFGKKLGTNAGTDTDEAVENTVAENGTVAAVAQASMPSVVAITSVSVQEIPSFFGY